jgi:Rieske Fe-S protein
MIIIPEHHHPHITRRAFCGALAVAPACALGAAAPIAAPPVGAARAEGTVNGLRHFVLLTRSTADVVAAVNGVCTHEGCIVTRFEAPAFECPCHGSRYDWRGTVLRGPAPAALPRLQTVFDGRLLRISV